MILRFFQEMSYKEIAQQTNEPMNNVKVKLLRAKKLLAEIIKNAKAWSSKKNFKLLNSWKN